MNYKAGDRVKAKSLDWYNKNKDKHGVVWTSDEQIPFENHMSKWCGKVMTISDVRADHYTMIEDLIGYWTDEMIEGLVEEETKPKFKVGDKVILDPYPCVVTDVNWRNSLHGFVYTVRGFDFGKMVGEEDLVLDEKTVPNTNEIIQLIKNDWNNFKDRYDIPDDYHFVDKNGNEINISEIVLEKKKKEYPKTYEECSVINGCDNRIPLKIIGEFTKLINARNAYWRIAGQEMGLDKPWEPDYTNTGEKKFSIWVDFGEIKLGGPFTTTQMVLTFPTEEMRDAFYENFKKEIEICKELL